MPAGRKLTPRSFSTTKSYAAYLNTGLKGFIEVVRQYRIGDDIAEFQAILYFATNHFGTSSEALAARLKCTRSSFSHWMFGKLPHDGTLHMNIMGVILIELQKE